jgi:hypothetical protein
MKVSVTAALGALTIAALVSAPAYAEPRVHTRWAPPSPFTPFTPPLPLPIPLPVVGPTPASPTACNADTKCVVKTILSDKGQFIADIQQARDTQAAVLNTVTGQAWDPDGVMCIDGVPQIGTSGQPGYVQGAQGLVAWINSLQAPAVDSVPPLPGPNTAACTVSPASDFCTTPSLATVAEHGYLLAAAAESDVANITTLINNKGIPPAIKEACGAKVQDIANVALTAVNQAAAFVALLATFMPK